jgi:hypothetical protein
VGCEHVHMCFRESRTCELMIKMCAPQDGAPRGRLFLPHQQHQQRTSKAVGSQ